MHSSGKADIMMPCVEGLSTSDKIVSLTDCNAVVIDGHACIQVLKPPTQNVAALTFEYMAKKFFNAILSVSAKGNDGNAEHCMS